MTRNTLRIAAALAVAALVLAACSSFKAFRLEVAPDPKATGSSTATATLALDCPTSAAETAGTGTTADQLE